MDISDKLKTEQKINDPKKCDKLILLRDLFNFEISVDCPLDKILKVLYAKHKYDQQDKESGLIG